MGPLISLFWTSGDVCPGLKSQAGSLACVLPRLHAMDPRIKLCFCQNFNFDFYPVHQTRMHSSRMLTVRCSSRLPGGGGVSAQGMSAYGGVRPCGGVCPGEGLSRGRVLPRGVSAKGVSAQGVSAQGVCLPRKVSAYVRCLPGGRATGGCTPLTPYRQNS